MFGRLTWDAIPFNQPIPLITSLVVFLAVAAIAVWVMAQGLVALSLARVHHVHRPQAHRHHVHRAGAAYAGPRLRRCDHDARAAVARDRRSRKAICRPSITTRSSRRTARS